MPRALRARSSAGSIPSRRASWSICDSYPSTICIAPNPRIALVGGLLVKTTRASTETWGTRYGPAAVTAAYMRTSALRYAYAPESARRSTACATRRPSRDAPVRYRRWNGCRFGRASNDSWRDHTIRTGRRVFHARRPRKASTVMSSFPPNPPPTYGPMTRTLFWGTPSTSATPRKCSMTCVDTRITSTPSLSIQATPASGSRYAWSMNWHR